MACTVAVEEVIDEHYAGQQEALESDQAALKDTIETFRQEELEHRDIGLQHGAEEAPAYELLSGAVKAGSRSEERRVGRERGGTCEFRGWPVNEKKTKKVIKRHGNR